MVILNLEFVDGSPGDLEVLYNELTMVSNKQEQRAMSEQTKKTVKEAGEFFKKVQQDAEKYKSIPDKDLGGKIQKVQEGAGEVVKHIQEKSGSNG
jgi:uncharacterized FlaG/YvyC family protein